MFANVLLKMRALNVWHNRLQRVTPEHLPETLRFLVTCGNPLGQMGLWAWRMFFNKLPHLTAHDTLPGLGFGVWGLGFRVLGLGVRG